jgi:hypothetical protein
MFRLLFVLVVIGFLFFEYSNTSLQSSHLIAEIKIADKSYGFIGDELQLNSLQAQIHSALNSNSGNNLVLNREFLTDRSLYLWAKNNFYEKKISLDVKIILRTTTGSIVNSYEFKNCYPMSWTLEAGERSRGGYKEHIKLNFTSFTVL